MQLRSDITIGGTPGSIDITGRIKTLEGHINYLDRKFKINEGILDFLGTYSNIPTVKFDASHRMKDFETYSKTAYLVTLKMNGPLDSSLPMLTSVPSATEADIISLLTLGATRAELTNNKISDRNGLIPIITERAGQLTSKKISSYTTRKIGSSIGLSSMSIEGNLFRFDKSWGPQLLASRKITDKMSISYRTTVGNANDQEIRLDYKLAKRISIQGQTNQKGESGVDLKYKVSFP